MTEQVIKEAITSTPASNEPKCEDLLINSRVTMDDSTMTPDVKRKEKPIPHYLRASTSSCHDNCKFGIKHSFEPKKYWPVSRKQLRRASTGNQELDRVQIVLPQKNRSRKEDQDLKISHVKGGDSTAPAKPEFITLKAPLEKVADHSESIPHVEHSSAEAPELVVAGTLPIDAKCFVVTHDDVTDGDGESLDGPESIELEMPLAIQDIDESDEHTEDAILPADNVCGVEEQAPVDSVPDQSEKGCASSDIRTPQAVIASEKHEQAKLGTKSESLPKGSVKPKTKATLSMTRDKGSNQKSGRTTYLTSPRTKVDSSSGPKTARKPADVTATTKFSNPERKFRPTVTSAAQKVKEIKVQSASNADDSSEGPSGLAKLKASKTKTAPSPSLASRKQTDRKMSGNNVGKNAQILPKREDKVKTGPLKLSRSIYLSGKSLSGVKLRTVRKEKIAPPINSSKKVSGTENSSSDAKEAKQRILKTASSKVRKLETSNKEIVPRKEKIDTARTATARRAKPASAAASSTVVPPQPPRKLTFRRGKVLNPDESSGSTPRRLRFRPAIATADATARSRGGRVTSSSRRIGGGAAARDAGAEVVVLRRRQDDGKETKKQEPGLFNNVIEETASRLVTEARKSKVKALVGAFETVISLQETSKAAAPAMAAGIVPKP